MVAVKKRDRQIYTSMLGYMEEISMWTQADTFGCFLLTTWLVKFHIACNDDAASPYGDIKRRRSLAQQDYFNLGPSLSFLGASSLLKLRVPTRKVRAIPVLKERRKSLTPVIAAPPPQLHPSTLDPFSSTSERAHWGNDLPAA